MPRGNKELQRQILDFLRRPASKPVTAAGLAKKLKIPRDERPAFQDALNHLLGSGQIYKGKKGRLKPRAAPGLIAGIIKKTAKGSGYLIPHEKPPDGRGGDIYISRREMRDAHTGDEVVVALSKRRRAGGQRTGRVEEILERATNTFVGTYFEQDGQGFVEVDGRTFNEPVYVGDPGAKGARPEDKVVVEMLRFPSHYQPAEAVLTEVLGTRGDPGVDTLSIIHEFGLPVEFPDEVLEDARRQAETFEESDLSDRRDLTGETIVTIDPATARDFDDAISLKKTREGHWQLGVHIADVAEFVEPGSPLDQEARKRGNSVYLPQRVLPMLPELISNGLASLQQDRVRYAKSVFIEFSPDGVPLHTEFANSAIRVTRRFTYEEVLPIIQEPERHRGRISANVRKLLSQMHELAMLLRRRRFEAGALELSLGEVEIDLDAEGRVVGAHQVQHDESHQIIEEFMLAANVAVAGRLSDRDVPFLRRIHPQPDDAKLQALATFAETLGYSLSQYRSRPALQELLNQVHGEPTEHALNYALLRSLKQAEYSGQDMGHYALAVDDYCHFTSPIRRYPDLMVHRLIDQLIRGREKLQGPDEAALIKIGKQCSHTERRAEKAERELTKIKLLEYMSDRIGEELDAVITGVESFGIFCQGMQMPVEGLVHISTLSEIDKFYFDRKAHSLIGFRTGRQFRLGQTVRVVVAHVDVDDRELDFRLVSQKPSSWNRSRGKGKSEKPPKRDKTSSEKRSGRKKQSSRRKKRR